MGLFKQMKDMKNMVAEARPRSIRPTSWPPTPR
jgi:hypothetical protein